MISGIASDKVGKYNSFIVSCFATGLCILALWIPASTDNALIAFAALFGFFSGAYVSLIGALVAQISPLQEIGFRQGLVFLVSALPGLTTGPIAGVILDHSGGWLGLKVFGGVLLLTGTMLILATRVSFTGLKVKAVF
jgi:MFS transporter, MCT family, aspergillic acid transporter